MSELNLRFHCNDIKTICFREDEKPIDDTIIKIIIAMQPEIQTMFPLDKMEEDVIFILLCTEEGNYAMCFAKEKGVNDWMDSSSYLILYPEDKTRYFKALKRGEDILLNAMAQYSESSNIAIYHFCDSKKGVEIHFIKDVYSTNIKLEFTDKYIGNIMDRDKSVTAFDRLLGGEDNIFMDERNLVVPICKDAILQMDFEQLLENYWGNILRFMPNTYTKVPGASDDEISGIESKMGMIFPDTVKTLYRFMNGDSENMMGFILGMEMFSLDEMLKIWSSWRGFDDDKELNNPDRFYSKPSKRIKLQYCNPGWIPLSGDHNSNYIGIDLDPDTDGDLGQVITFGRDENEKIVIALSLPEFFRWALSVQSEMGMFNDGKQYLYLNEKSNPPAMLGRIV